MQFLYCILFWYQNLLNKEETALISNSMLEIYCVYLEEISTLGVSIQQLPLNLTAGKQYGQECENLPGSFITRVI